MNFRGISLTPKERAVLTKLAWKAQDMGVSQDLLNGTTMRTIAQEISSGRTTMDSPGVKATLEGLSNFKKPKPKEKPEK